MTMSYNFKKKLKTFLNIVVEFLSIHYHFKAKYKQKKKVKDKENIDTDTVS